MGSTLDPKKIVGKLFDASAGDNMFIDGDTVRTSSGESIRIDNINTPEVAHSSDYTDDTDYHAAGQAYHQGVAKIAQEGGFTDVYRSGKKDKYGRSIGDMVNPDTGERLSYKLASEGLTRANPYSDETYIDQKIIGTAQRNAGAERDEASQEAFDVISDSIRDSNGDINFKTLALDESEYDPDLHAGVTLRHLDRTLDNEALSPLSTSFDTALLGMSAGFSGMKQAIGFATGNREKELQGQIAVAYKQGELAKKPEVLIDYKDVDSISNAFSYVANNAAMSSPYMANTIATAVAGSVAGSVIGTAVTPVLGTAVGGVLGAIGGTIVGLSSTTAVYAGQVYNSQDEKNWQVAMSSGLAQAAMDRVGLKGLQVGGKTLKAVLKEGEDVLTARLVAKGVSSASARTQARATIGKATKTELMGLVQDADNIIAKQLSARNVTRALLNRAAKGAGSEAVTEAAQETLAQIGEDWNEENFGILDHGEFNSEFLDRITNAAVAGGALGGSLGGAGGVAETGSWANAAWNRGDSNRSSFEGELAKLEGNSEIGETLDSMKRSDETGTEIIDMASEHVLENKGRDMTERAVDSFKNLPMLWRGMMRARMAKDSLIKSTSYRQLGAMFGATVGRFKAGRTYEESMHFLNQSYVNLIGDSSSEKIFYRGLAKGNPVIGARDSASKAKFGSIINQVDTAYNAFLEANPKMSEQQANAAFDWSRWDGVESDVWHKYSKDPNKNMVRHFVEQRQKAASIMRQRQNIAWNKNGKDSIDPITGMTIPYQPQEKIKRLRNYFGKFKAINREIVSDKRADFELLLRSEASMSKSAATDLTNKILDGEPLDGLDEGVFDLLTKGIPATQAKKRTMALSQHPKFTEFFHQDPFHNFKEGARMAARFETFHNYVGKDNWRVTQLLKEAEKQGVPKKEINMMAKSIQQYLEAQSGNYKRPPKGSYGERAIGVQRTILLWSLATSLPLSALSSTVELMLTAGGLTQKQIFGNIMPMSMELAKGMGRYLHRVGNEVFTGREYIPEGENMKVLQHLGYMTQEAGAASTVGATEQSDWAKTWVDRFFKANFLHDLTNANRAMRLAQFGDYTRDHIEIIKNSDPKSEMYRFSKQELLNLGVPVDKYITLYAMDEGSMTPKQKQQYQEYEDQAMYNFINQTVALPGTANRPLLYQDPRLALFTQFNGYIATFTANHIPRLWGDYVKRGSPAMKYNTFAMMTSMIFMGFASQYLKDWLKYGEPSPYLNSTEKLRRAVNSSGLLGQSERALNFIWPTFEKRDNGMIQNTFEMVTDEMPAMGPMRRLLKAADYAYEGNTDMAQYNAMRATPVLGPFTKMVQNAAGVDFDIKR